MTNERQIQPALADLAKLGTMSNQQIRLQAGEMTAQEMRSVRAFLSLVNSQVNRASGMLERDFLAIERETGAGVWEAAARMLESGMPAEVVARMARENAAALRAKTS